MAILAATRVGSRAPAGNYWRQTFEVECSTGTPADEWFETGFYELVAATPVTLGDTDRGINVLLNAQGTGAATTSKGSVGIEASGACTAHVTVLGR
jgi:hypothetical protein